MFPGYILVEMVMSDEAWYVVRNTPGVTGFIGSSGKGAKPTPLQPYEVDTILRNMGISRFDTDETLEIGTKVKIISGPFNGMYGTIAVVDMENQKLELNVDLFGQETSVEVELSQIEVA
jgi:transcriptional antiterminator NusG